MRHTKMYFFLTIIGKSIHTYVSRAPLKFARHSSNRFLIRVAWRRALSLNSEGSSPLVHIVFVGGRQEAPEEEKIRWLQYHQRPASSRHIEIRVVSCGILSCKPWKQMIDSCNMDIKDKGYHLCFAHVLLKFATFYFNLKVLFSWKTF
jgi:hypothetical protein